MLPLRVYENDAEDKARMRTLGNEGAGEWVTVGRGTSGAIAGTASYVVLSFDRVFAAQALFFPPGRR